MTARLTLALLFVIPAAMAYPWPSTADRWLLGVAVAVVVILFAWWRDTFVTTMLARRVRVWRRNRTRGKAKRVPATRTTVLLRVDPEPPLELLARYLDRYGLRADSVRITNRQSAAGRMTWVGLTLDAADNLPALAARSPAIPLYETAEIAIRRLGDHLREAGYDTAVVEHDDVPSLPDGKETWRGVHTDSGFVTAYQLTSDERPGDTLTAARSQPSGEIWTALEISGTATRPTVAAACALLTEQPPAKRPLPGLTPQRGRQRLVLDTLHPLSAQRLG